IGWTHIPRATPLARRRLRTQAGYCKSSLPVFPSTLNQRYPTLPFTCESFLANRVDELVGQGQGGQRRGLDELLEALPELACAGVDSGRHGPGPPVTGGAVDRQSGGATGGHRVFSELLDQGELEPRLGRPGLDGGGGAGITCRHGQIAASDGGTTGVDLHVRHQEDAGGPDRRP